MFVRPLAALVLAGLAFPAAAGGQTFRVDYSVSILGLDIAQSSFESRIGERDFSVSGTLASSGIARIFDSTEGTASVSGNLGEHGAQAQTYLLRYRSGEKDKRTEVAFAGGRVTKAQNLPARKRDQRIWVPLRPAHLVAVTDPLSATMVKAPGLRQVCGRTLKVFDGEMRANLKLSFVETTQAQTRGYSGDAVTCQARFMPIGGYKGGNRSIEFLKNKSKILITFAQLGTTGIYAPIKVSATTQIGTLVVNARRFETVSQ